ncbi:MAG: MATE family efflux transporter [Bacteroidetes bacterium]|nr:MATE family efflux transporter [Bacteroidota bacterium]
MKDLTNGSERKLIFQFALPMLLGNVFQQLYNIVDSIIVGNFIGKEALAAVGASFPIIFLMIALIIGIASGSTIVIAQFFGARDYQTVRKMIDTLFIFLFFASLLVTFIGITFTEQILRIIQLPEELIPGAKDYLSIYLAGIIVFFGFNGISSILRGLGDSKTPMYFLIISTVMNIGFDLLFVLVFKWGIKGVAIATILSQGIAFILAIIYLNSTHKIIRFSLKNLTFDMGLFKKSFRIGLPTGIQHTFVSLGMMAVLTIVNLFGTNVIAAYSVVLRINSIASLPAMNFAAALATFVGQNLGAGKTHRVTKGLKETILMSSLVSVSVSILVIVFGKFLMVLFTPDPEVIRIGKEYLIIVGSFYIIFSIMFSINGALRGAGDTLIPMFITLLSLWFIRVPVAYLLSKSIDETGIWWAFPIGWLAGAVLSYLYYLTGRWKTKVVVGKQKPETGKPFTATVEN